MHRNQYLITTRAPQPLADDWPAARQVGPWFVFLMPPLQAAFASGRGFEMLLLGTAVLPSAPALSTRDFVDELATRHALTPEAAAAACQALTGRFVVMFLSQGVTHFWGDACHLRQILHGQVDGADVVCSSEKLALAYAEKTLSLNAEKRAFMASVLYDQNEQAWVGESAQDDRFRRLLPNHWLHWPGEHVARRPLSHAGLPHATAAILSFSAEQLRGCFAALSGSRRLLQGVTGGWDSRVLLAASLPFKQHIEYFVFDRRDAGSAADADVAQQLGRALDFPLQRITPSAVTPAFADPYQHEHHFARILPKTANVQHRFERQVGDSVYCINGNGAEIARCYYGLPMPAHSERVICHLLGYSQKIDFVAHAVHAWYPGAKQAARALEVGVLDLLYWEQRMGTWGAQAPFEMDIAVEEVSPFNNINLMLALLRIPAAQRCAPAYGFFRQLVQVLNPAAAEVAVNPHVAGYKKWLARYALTVFGAKWAKHRWVERKGRYLPAA